MPKTDIAAIILAAGKGTRMKSDLPKVLHQVAGRSMLGHVIQCAHEIGANRQIVVIGPDMPDTKAAAQAENPDAEIAVQYAQMGTADAVNAARDNLAGFKGDALVLYADTPLLTLPTLHSMLDARRAGAAVVVLGFRPDDPAEYGRLVTSDSGDLDAIIEFKECTSAQREIGFCNSGVMAIDGELLFTLLSDVNNDNAKGEYYLTDIVEIARRHGHRCAAVEADPDEVLGVNSRVELAQAEAICQDRMRHAAMLNGATLRDPKTTYFSYDTRLGRDVIVGQHVVFGPGVTVADGAIIHPFSHLEGAIVSARADIGPYARLRPGAEIGPRAKIGNFVEIKKTRVEEGAKVNHLSYIGDARVGKAANVGAGTITCNYDGFNKHFTDIGEGAFIGSNSCLVAPVKIGDGAYTASGAVVTDDVSEDALVIVRPPQVEKADWAKNFRLKNAGKKN